MFKKRKKILSAFLALCIILAMFTGGTISVSADDTLISGTATITNIPIREAGGSIAETKPTVSAPEGCIAEAHWHKWDTAQNDYVIVNEGTFTDTDVYYLCIEFKAADGYSFSDDFEIIVPDGYDENIWRDEHEDSVTAYYCAFPASSFGTEIFSISVDIPEVKAGATASIEDTDYTFKTNDSTVSAENFDINAEWFCESKNYDVVNGQKFQNGHVYSLSLEIDAKPGYYFSESLVLEYGDRTSEFVYDSPTHASFYYTYSLETPIEKVELAGLPEGNVGDIMVESLELIDKNKDFDISINWDDGEDDTNGMAMEDGKVYTVHIEAYMPTSVPLSENFVFIIDGVEYKATYVDDNNIQPCYADLYLEYDFSGNDEEDDKDEPTENILEKLVITDFPNVKAGEVMVTESSLTIENLPSEYALYIGWYDENGNDVTGKVMEEGHVYTAQLHLEALYGDAVLSDNFVFVINGTEYKPTKVDEYNSKPLYVLLGLKYDIKGNTSADDITKPEDTNKPENKPSSGTENKNDSSAKTGDSSNVLLWMVLAIASMGTIVFIRRKKAY